MINGIKTIAFDLDDTLVSFREPMCNLLNDLTNSDIHWDKWKTYDAASYYGMTSEEFCQQIVEHEILKKLQPHIETKEVLTTLQNMGYHIAIISARGFHPNAEILTRNWFIENDIAFDSIHINKHGYAKINMLDAKYDVKLAIDDHVDHGKDYIDSNRVQNVLLYDMPWNKDSEILRIKTLKEIYNYV